MRYLKLTGRVLYLFANFWRMDDEQVKAEMNKQRALLGRKPIP